MKITIRNISILLIMALVIPITAISCNDDDSSAANLSFSRSIYILPSSGNLEVELRASIPPENDLIVPINIEGTAELNEDYEISAKEFIIKAGETSGKLILTPKNNLISGREIRLSINPVSGYGLGDKKTAIIPIEIKERIMYSFISSYSRVLSTVEIWVELQGEFSGKSFKALSDITLPLEIGSSSTAIIGTDFTAPTSITIPKGGRQAHFTVAIQEEAEDYAGKKAIINLKSPDKDESDLYYAGSFIAYSLNFDQVKFIDMLGKWKPVEITNEINFELYEIPAEDMVNLPKNNNENDYLEFIHADGNDIIIPHLTGNLKNFFCNPNGHKVVFDHIEKGLLDWDNGDEYDAPYYIISGANKFFSSQKSEPTEVILGIDKIDDNNIMIYFHEYIPTDFFVSTYNDYDEEFDVDMFGINYKFTRVAE